MKDGFEKYQKQHLKNYHDALVDTIHDNTRKLIEEDLIPLFKKPPLDSMDVLKIKILSNAKDAGVILSIQTLDTMIEHYRTQMITYICDVGSLRENKIEKSVNQKFIEKKEKEELLSTDFSDFKEEAKIKFGENFISYIKENFVPNLNELLDKTKNMDEVANDLFITNTCDYLNNRYTENLLQTLDNKITLKDNILVNRLNEHRSRFEFTNEHSRLLEYETKI